MTRTEQQRKRDLHDLAAIVATIETQQEAHPGYEADTARAIVNVELMKMEEATGIDLDDIAADYPFYLRRA